eukprot:scaffold286508_cov52-Prasinocladus_malaysianus.AAC.1
MRGSEAERRAASAGFPAEWACGCVHEWKAAARPAGKATAACHSDGVQRAPGTSQAGAAAE